MIQLRLELNNDLIISSLTDVNFRLFYHMWAAELVYGCVELHEV